jgi:hypothetical protein
MVSFSRDVRKRLMVLWSGVCMPESHIKLSLSLAASSIFRRVIVHCAFDDVEVMRVIDKPDSEIDVKYIKYDCKVV